MAVSAGPAESGGTSKKLSRKRVEESRECGVVAWFPIMRGDDYGKT